MPEGVISKVSHLHPVPHYLCTKATSFCLNLHLYNLICGKKLLKYEETDMSVHDCWETLFSSLIWC